MALIQLLSFDYHFLEFLSSYQVLHLETQFDQLLQELPPVFTNFMGQSVVKPPILL